ncbi:mechanosensitive ion channel family protein [Flavobacterium subsaxonicum]|uniref:Membrane protein n=1 Tax=Flavobacterium subsaxonicum WB 4.1-42 = DSM 21790 TaxID=1121898 RepID=A0A0A2MIJ6_9FLAO|nr:mechanosensitive ion channel domain-containing protein [Flavobacterium subsaxonicum]KGO91421.1 membrane protein [Flavobacterium subsaxonicum WB 4.1-42 = DSM 21790]
MTQIHSNSGFLQFLVFGALGLVLTFSIVFFILKRVGKDPKNLLPVNFANRIKFPLLLIIIALVLRIGLVNDVFLEQYIKIIGHVCTLVLIFAATWSCIVLLRAFKSGLMRKYDITADDNLHARRVFTQFTILERVIIFLLVVFAIGIALMSFDNIRAIGISFLTSAGIAGIILGFSAQKMLATLVAGIQIAITQPIRLDDVVIVEGEWGWIEEITLTYVVVRIWDKRRMVLPTTYFIEKPFQNWTRTTSEILGTVFIYTDFMMPVDSLREELTRLLNTTPLWDGKVNVLQVTGATETGMEIRALMSSKNSPTSWDLRVFIREKLIYYIQQHYPESLPRTRIEMKSAATATTPSTL